MQEENTTSTPKKIPDLSHFRLKSGILYFKPIHAPINLL